MEKCDLISKVCGAIGNEDREEAARLVANFYPFDPPERVQRKFNHLASMRLFVRDGFIDRYSGQQLVFPPVLRLISRFVPEVFPFQSNWKTDACHFAYYELTPTIDHIIPVSRGGVDDATNWLTTSMVRNMAKSNFLLSEIEWSVKPPGDIRIWDGLTGWYLTQLEAGRDVATEPYFRAWGVAARTVLSEERQ